MTADRITCPRCEGAGTIYVMPETKGPGSRRKGVDAPCPVCRGTGTASMLEPMGEPEHDEVRREP